MQYSGMCDASAAVAVGSNLFVVASDEDNILRLYSSDKSGPPIKQFDCNAFLEVTDKSPEADLEAAALLGDRAFWIGSHGRNKDGKERPNRCRFFATDIKLIGREVSLTPVGKPCKSLLDVLIHDPRFVHLHLAEAATRAPKEPGALNIEGLSATPQGHLLLGFRNPIPDGRALLIPLINPNDVINGQTPRFDSPIRLDLGGLGIRDMTCYNGTYLIIAGSWHSGGKFQLYRWTGPGVEPEAVTVKHLGEYNPEAIIVYFEKGLKEIQILSDDGTRPIDGVLCKDLSDPSNQIFRSFWLSGK